MHFTSECALACARVPGLLCAGLHSQHRAGVWSSAQLLTARRVQYVLMLVSGGNAGMVKDIQIKVASARKVFRIMKARGQ